MSVSTTSSNLSAHLLCASSLARFQAGTPDVLSALFRRYRPEVARLVTFGTRGVRSVPEADRDDVLQVVFVHLFSPSARRAYDSARPFGAYVRVIALNVIRDYWRARTRGPCFADVDLNEVYDPAESNYDWSDISDWQRASKATAAYCDAQPPEVQRFIRLRYLEERSQRNMCQPDGWSRRQVRTLENAVRTTLNEHLRMRGIEIGALLT